jgi:hypothetical protein
VNCARTDLGGGRPAMGVPTATECNSLNEIERARRVHREIKKNPATADLSKAGRMVGQTGTADR